LGAVVDLAREVAYFSGLSRLAELRAGGSGAILRFQRVRERRRGRFQPLRSQEVTPRFLDRTIAALKRWKFDIVGIDEVIHRIAHPSVSQRYVCLTFDGASSDLMLAAYPVLSKHQVPFTVYLPTAFPDGVGEAWWLALERVVSWHDRIALVIGRDERRFDIMAAPQKYQTFEILRRWLRTLPPADLSAAINDLCKRYSVDLAELSREAFIGWDDVTKLAADPLVTIATATVDYPTLSNLPDDAAQRQIAMGRAVAQAALGRDPLHLAFPFGDVASFDKRHVRMAEEAGFASAVTAVPGLIWPRHPPDRLALPRIDCGGDLPLRGLRVLLSGLTLRPLTRPGAPSS
jgi:peptidoglycan/xylan/chitin deacetylase (PgdA/CDA1 family)